MRYLILLIVLAYSSVAHAEFKNSDTAATWPQNGFSCGVLAIEPAVRDNDPVHEIVVTPRFDSNYNVIGLEVTHVTTFGRSFKRSEQYSNEYLNNTEGKFEIKWYGSWNKRNSIKMLGRLWRDAGVQRWFYTETQSENNRLRMKMVAGCHPIVSDSDKTVDSNDDTELGKTKCWGTLTYSGEHKDLSFPFYVVGTSRGFDCVVNGNKKNNTVLHDNCTDGKLCVVFALNAITCGKGMTGAADACAFVDNVVRAYEPNSCSGTLNSRDGTKDAPTKELLFMNDDGHKMCVVDPTVENNAEVLKHCIIGKPCIILGDLQDVDGKFVKLVDIVQVDKR